MKWNKMVNTPDDNFYDDVIDDDSYDCRDGKRSKKTWKAVSREKMNTRYQGHLDDVGNEK